MSDKPVNEGSEGALKKPKIEKSPDVHEAQHSNGAQMQSLRDNQENIWRSEDGLFAIIDNGGIVAKQKEVSSSAEPARAKVRPEAVEENSSKRATGISTENEWRVFANLDAPQREKIVRAFSEAAKIGETEYRRQAQDVSISVPQGFFNVGKSVYEGFAGVGKFLHDIYFDRPAAEKTGSQVGETMGNVIVGGLKLGEFVKEYAVNVQQSGNYNKPISDLVTVTQILNRHWNSMSLADRTERVSELVANLALAGLGAERLSKSKNILDLFDELANVTSKTSSKPQIESACGIKKFISELADESQHKFRDPIHDSFAERSPEGILLAAAGSRNKPPWNVWRLRKSSDVVQQTYDQSCVSAVGEMLSNGDIKQEHLVKELGTVKVDPRKLAPHLGDDWIGEFIDKPTSAQVRGLCQNVPFGASLKQFGSEAHMVVVDGLQKSGRVAIRDPAHGCTYEMTVEDFAELCQAIVQRKD